jgi:hypothetical protein
VLCARDSTSFFSEELHGSPTMLPRRCKLPLLVYFSSNSWEGTSVCQEPSPHTCTLAARKLFNFQPLESSKAGSKGARMSTDEHPRFCNSVLPP